MTAIAPPTAAVPIVAPRTSWRVDPARSSVAFEVGKRIFGLVRLTVRGTIPVAGGRLVLDADDPGRSSANLAIRTAGVDTRSKQRDAHLRRADFFDAGRFPEATFVSRAVRPRADRPDAYDVDGDLVIKGVTRPVALEVTRESARDDGRVRFVGRATVNRFDLGLAWTSWYVAVAPDVRVTVEIEAVPDDAPGRPA